MHVKPSTLIMASLLISLVAPSLVYVGGELTDTLLIHVVVTREGKLVSSRLHVLAAMPPGFEFIMPVNATQGFADIRLSLSSLVNPWTAEYQARGRSSLPLVEIVAIGQGYMGVGFVTLAEEEFRGPVEKRVEIELNQKPPPREQSTSSSQVEPLGSVLVDWHEKDYYIDVGELRTNANSWGVLGGVYQINKKIGFTIDVFISGWTIGSYFWIWKNEQSPPNEAVNVLRSEIGYIWMKTTYRFEHWVIDEIYHLYQVYIRDFYPSTVDATTEKKGSEAQIEEWVYDGTNSSTNPLKYLFYRLLFTTSFRASSVDVLDYIVYLYEVLKKIPKSVKDAAFNLGALLIDVNFVYSLETAFALNMVSYADAGTTHKLYYIRDYYKGVPYPAYYWKIVKV